MWVRSNFRTLTSKIHSLSRLSGAKTKACLNWACVTPAAAPVMRCLSRRLVRTPRFQLASPSGSICYRFYVLHAWPHSSKLTVPRIERIRPTATSWLHHGVCSSEQVMGVMQKMAVVVDEQNKNDAAYEKMAGNFDTSIAFKAACDLVFVGRIQPSGYTEPVLHRRRLEKKSH